MTNKNENGLDVSKVLQMTDIEVVTLEEIESRENSVSPTIICCEFNFNR